MTTTPWNPDVSVAVHDDELIVKLDHLPEMHRFEAEIEAGEVLVLTENLLGEVDHDLHLPLPDGLEISRLSTALNGEAFELHLYMPCTSGIREMSPAPSEPALAGASDPL